MPNNTFEALKRMQEKTAFVMSDRQIASERDMLAYQNAVSAYHENRVVENDEKETKMRKALHDRIMNLALLTSDAEIEEMRDVLPAQMIEERQQKLAIVRENANRSGMEKVKKDFWGQKKRDAKEFLKKTEAVHKASEMMTESQHINLQEEAQKTKSTGRWISPLRTAMNYVGLGPHRMRHDKKVYEEAVSIHHIEGFDNDDKLTYVPREINVRTNNGTLNGAIYRPSQLGSEKITSYRTTAQRNKDLLELVRNQFLQNSEKIEKDSSLSEEEKESLRKRNVMLQRQMQRYTQSISADNAAADELAQQLEGKTTVDAHKLVIFYSGSHGSGAGMVKNVAKTYLDAGASVLNVNYRGFGNSVSQKVKKGPDGLETRKKTGTHLCEQGMYEDARAIYDYAINELGYKPSEVILHGFSLGGAIATKIAADIAQDNAATNAPEEQKLGGVVVHSAIDSMYKMATRTVGGLKVAGFAGWAGAGGYNTTSHLRRLNKFDPNIPIHFRGGHGDGDLLSLDTTRLDRIQDARFKNSSSYYGHGGHQDSSDQAANMDFGTQPLEQMVQHGRAVNLKTP